MAGQRLNRFNFEVLRYLRAYAAGEKGWHWRGVSGWIFAAEFPQRLRLASSYLPTLSNHYCVDRSNVGDPFQHQATYLYRISAVGLAMLGAHEQQEGAEGCIPAHVTIQQPADTPSAVEAECIFITPWQWRGLEYLQEERSGGHAPGDIAKAIDSRFYMNDAELLVRKRLAVMELPPGGRRKFRISNLGSKARAVDTTTSRYIALIHVPGVREAAEQQRSEPTLVTRGFSRLGGFRDAESEA